MKRFLVAVLCSVFLSPVAAPQQVEGNTPASRDDIQRYLQVTHSRDMINKMVDAMLKPMHQFTKSTRRTRSACRQISRSE